MSTILAEEPKVRHSLPGRVRFHWSGWSGEGAEVLEAHLQQLPGVQRVQANPLTATILVHFDPSLIKEQTLLVVLRTEGPSLVGMPCSKLQGVPGRVPARSVFRTGGQGLRSLTIASTVIKVAKRPSVLHFLLYGVKPLPLSVREKPVVASSWQGWLDRALRVGKVVLDLGRFILDHLPRRKDSRSSRQKLAAGIGFLAAFSGSPLIRYALRFILGPILAGFLPPLAALLAASLTGDSLDLTSTALELLLLLEFFSTRPHFPSA